MGYDVRDQSGKTVALVGTSGSGKSTLIALLLRFYDVTGGRILIDGRDIRSENVRRLRDQLAVVSQEPRLFDATVEENILYGKVSVVSADNATL